MIIAISSTGSGLRSIVDSRFGRAQGFILKDTESDTVRFLDNNQNLTAAQGAGIQAAQTVISAGADVVITGNCGPKAFRALSAADISIHTAESLTVSEALDLFKGGELRELSMASVEGHW